ncbi:hypothetical protein BC939DRAFT_441169 [Gamsiella multidivaricata]|uniref:uncharacterized protein n=1 Tax=Gamsiella multidivaricata TaxID=101098 RepID=UPI00221FCBFB|nr:uncharacterized protein BC939DRAFT_441169 [Gamsiella multidivaricata]KAG0370725.1 hypothetical protein BGZ54_004463 [Gamsiella multidivaricata]KAI7829589.1 hypothetical protein BC939DRAFT_441169 [Gamsiella multidivaricata]
MAQSAMLDNQLILQRATNSCGALDDLRYRLHTIQKRLAKSREQRPLSASSTSTGSPEAPTRDETLAELLQEAYTLQFQISILLAATEEPIPERQRITKQEKKIVPS